MNNTLLYPPSIDWELTSVCNHNCIHCYNYWRGLNSDEGRLPSEEYFDIVARKIIESHPVSVQITGGEPLVVWSKAKHAIQLLVESGIIVSINTNATLVNDEIADFFYRNNMDAFVSFPCSKKSVFDEIVHCKGAADRAEKGILTLLKHNVSVSLNMVVTKINYPYIYETALYAREKFNASYFSATKASFPQNAVSSFRDQMLDNSEFNSMLETLNRLKKETGMRVDSAWVYSMCGFRDKEILEQFGFNRKCTCGRYNFVIDANGNMKACGCDSRTYGNILADTFQDAISRMNEWQSCVLLPRECQNCANLAYCGGGCRSDAYSTTGNRCGMDSTANIMYKNKYIIKLQKANAYPDEFTISINPDVKVITESCGIRLSIGTNYAFITNRFYAYLAKNSCITFGKLKVLTGLNENELVTEIGSLLKKRILIPTSMKEGMADLSEVNFSILANPYTSSESTKIQRDYVCNFNIRHFNNK